MNIESLFAFIFATYFSLINANFRNNENSYAISTEALLKLFRTEEFLINNMKLYVEELKEEYKIVKRELMRLHAYQNEMEADYETFLGNPLNSFALIRHQYNDWDYWAEFMRHVVGEDYISRAQQMRSELPTARDLKDANRGIQVLIEYYNLHPNELAAGALSGHYMPGTALSSLDCFAMGKFNMFQKKYSHAETWFNASLKKYDAKCNLQYKVYAFNEQEIQNWLIVLMIELKRYIPGNYKIQMKNSYKFGDILNEHSSLLALKTNCSVGLHRPTYLHCRYNNFTTPFLRIAPLKMEELSTDPMMILYHDVLYDSEIEWLGNRKLNLRPAFLYDSTVSTIRTAKDTVFESGEHEVISAIEGRLNDMTGYNIKDSERLSLINYGIGGFYDLHPDTDHMDGFNRLRIATVLFYLHDVELGGATTFPSLNLTIPPVKGTALFWHNLRADDQLHPKTVHAACPVIVGSKYVMTQWISYVPQMFIQPCKAN